MRQIGRDSITNLMVLLCSATLEKVIVWKRLKPRGLPDSEAPALRWIVMDKIMTILGYVASYSGCWSVCELYSEAVRKIA
jgi:hypothetical protein